MNLNKINSLDSRIIKTVSLIFLLSLFFNRDGNIYFFYFSFAIYSAISLFLNIRNYKHVKIPSFIWGYLAFCILAGISTKWSVDKQLSLMMTSRLFIILFLIYITYVNIKVYSTSNLILISLIIGIFLNFVLFIFPIWDLQDTSGRFSGTLDNSNLLAIMAIFAIYFYTIYYLSSTNKSTIVYFIVTSICFAVILVTGSRKGFIFGGLIFAIGFINSLKMNKKFSKSLFFFLLIIVFFILILNIDLNEFELTSRLKDLVDFAIAGGDYSGAELSMKWRYRFAETAFDVFKSHPFLGVGIDAFQFYTGDGHYAHNNYLEILADLGICGLAIYYLIYFFIIRKLIRSKAKLIQYGLIGALMLMEISLVTYYTRQIWIFLVYFVVSLSVKHTVESKPNITNNKFLKKLI